MKPAEFVLITRNVAGYLLNIAHAYTAAEISLQRSGPPTLAQHSHPQEAEGQPYFPPEVTPLHFNTGNVILHP